MGMGITTMAIETAQDPFYMRYYVGHQGRHGHEFIEFELSGNRLRYANNSNYRQDSLIRKEEDDSKWPQKNIVGKQELEIKLGNDHISFQTAKIGSLVDVQSSEDPEGMRVFYYLIQDLKIFVFSLVN